MTTASNVQVEEAVLPELPSADATRRGALRAKSVTPPPSPAEGDTPGGHAASRARLALLALPTVLSGTSLLATQPPSLTQAWARHAECARHYQRWYFRWPRYVWGGAHLPLVAVLYALGWVTHCPPLFFTAAGILAACWFLH